MYLCNPRYYLSYPNYPRYYYVSEMVMALIDAAYDKDGAVKQVITDSLFELGKKQPALVLSSCHSYLVKHSKVHL